MGRIFPDLKSTSAVHEAHAIVQLRLMRLPLSAAPRRFAMHPRKRLWIKSATVAGIATGVLLELAGLAFNPTPAKAGRVLPVS